jgi:hypothetical protein
MLLLFLVLAEATLLEETSNAAAFSDDTGRRELNIAEERYSQCCFILCYYQCCTKILWLEEAMLKCFLILEQAGNNAGETDTRVNSLYPEAELK